MRVVEVVENPRRKKRRYTRKQRAYGFGGKRRRRRNPSLGVLSAANPRRRRRYRRSAPRRYSRRRNPAFIGGMFGTVDLTAILYVTGGIIGTKTIPGLVQRWFPGLPTVGVPGMAVRGATVLLLGAGVKMFTKSNVRATQVVTGGLAVLALEAWDRWVSPALGLGGDYVGTEELGRVTGMGRFIQTPRGLGRFVETPRGLGATMIDIPDEALAA